MALASAYTTAATYCLVSCGGQGNLHAREYNSTTNAVAFWAAMWPFDVMSISEIAFVAGRSVCLESFWVPVQQPTTNISRRLLLFDIDSAAHNRHRSKIYVVAGQITILDLGRTLLICTVLVSLILAILSTPRQASITNPRKLILIKSSICQIDGFVSLFSARFRLFFWLSNPQVGTIVYRPNWYYQC